MVILKAINSFGVTRRCDRSCYEAKGKRCRCCCGGKNHGVGLNQAIENAGEIVKEAAAGNVPEGLEQATFERLAVQLEMFA